MKSWALIETRTGRIANRIALDDPEKWTAPEGFSLVEETAGALEIGGTWADDAYTPPVREPVPLASKTDLLARIDARAEQIRLRYITAGAGQAMTYREKADEARTILALPDGEAKLEDFPVTAGSVGIEAATLREVAVLVMERHAAWASLGGAIERVRLGAKKSITAAADDAAANAVYESVVWPT